MALRDLTKPNPSRLPGIIRLLIDSIQDYRRCVAVLVGVSLVAAVLLAVLSPLEVSAEGLLLRAYGSVLGLIMNLALIWSVVRLQAGHRPTVKQAYYEGTQSAVRFTLVTTALGLQMLPFAFGGVLFSAATSNVSVAVTLPEQLLILLLWFTLAAPSVYWLTRYVFSAFIVASTNQTPIQALRASRLLVKGRFWAVLHRLLGLLLILTVLSVLPMVALLLLLPAAWTVFGLALWQLVVTISLLPIAYLFLHRLTLSLASSSS